MAARFGVFGGTGIAGMTRLVDHKSLSILKFRGDGLGLWSHADVGIGCAESVG